MPSPRTVFTAGRAALVILGCAGAVRAQAAPTGPHPRLWLDAPTLASLAAQHAEDGSPVARAAKRCAAARTNPAKYDEGGWQGFEFVITLSSCLTAWKAAGNPEDAETAVKYWKVLLDDYHSVGDGAGGDDVVQHDGGYAMRTFAPYSALAYDWLHDAPGVTEELRSRSRQRFAAWMSWYASDGYLPHMPGANYQAGYLFAATLIAVAEAGEAGATGEAHWATVRDVLWGKDMQSALAPGGVLVGGDWPEGWQYGPLSVVEYSLAARALAEHGLAVPGVAEWSDALVLRFRHALTPVTRQLFVAGDIDKGVAHMQPPSGPLLAAVSGAASDGAKAWARQLAAELASENENPLFDALAAARGGPSAAFPGDAPRNHWASGAGNWYVRGAWAPETIWAVLQCSRRRVADHQHNDAGNFVLTRGADDLVVDPSPYGSMSTLSSNAPAADSESVPSGYSPSQADWGEATRMVWQKQLSSGVAVARCDYADQFRYEDQPSDVAPALRDFVLIPSGADGTLVLVDRAGTSAGRSLHLRVRSPATLTLDGDLALGTLGASSLFVRRAWSENGDPSVREMPRASECSASERDSCDGSRLPAGWEYRLDVMGPAARAIHVIDAAGAGALAPASTPIEGSGFRGVLVERAGKRVAVVGSQDPSIALAGYRVAAGAGALHVVLDAPAGAQGLVDASGAREGEDCAIDLAPHSGSTGGFPAQPLVVGVTESCEVVAEEIEPSGGTGGVAGAGGAAPGAAPKGPVEGGCGCRTAGGLELSVLALSLLGVALAVARHRRSHRARVIAR